MMLRYWYVVIVYLLFTWTFVSADEWQTGLIEIAYEGSDAIFANPERGFYRWREGRLGSNPLTLSDLQTNVRNLDYSLIIRLYYLPEFRDQDLDEQILDLIQTDFDVMREAGIKAILRFRYSKSETEPDAPLEIVQRHLDQLKPLFEKNYDIIAVVQAGFVGAWGEWHASSNNLTSLSNKRAVLSKLLEVLPPERMTQLRYPSDKMSIYTTQDALVPEQAYDNSDIARTGHHNDCFLASPTDVGTYRISAIYEKNYLHLDNRYVPMGGETCRVREGERYKCETALVELEQMRWSFLNRDYYSGTIGSWITDGCMDEVQRRLGYRFSLLEGRYSDSVKRNSEFHTEINITNHGWAAPYNPRGLELLLRNVVDGTIYFTELPEDPRFWLGGDTVRVNASIGVPSTIPAGDYELLLHFPDPTESLYGRPEYSIRLANSDVWENESGYNDLLHTLTVEEEISGDGYESGLVFRLFGTPSVIGRKGTRLPESTRLFGNYPNPFNPVTTIRYKLGIDEKVKLKIYNSLGQKVNVLVDEVQRAGVYDVPFDASGLASGTYFFRLSTSSFTESRSMMLLR
jgi:hypothetical protein